MKNLGLRSPFDEVASLVYFGRMVDQIRTHARGELPPAYQADLGKGLDEYCANFLFRVSLSGSIRRRDIGSRSSADKTTAANDAGHLRLKIVRRDWSHYDGWDAVGAPQRHR